VQAPQTLVGIRFCLVSLLLRGNAARKIL